MMCDTPHWLKCLYERVMSSTCSSMSCVWVSVLWLTVHRLVPFRVSLLSLALLFPFVPGPWPEPLPPCGRRQGNYPLALGQLRRLAPWSKTPSHRLWTQASWRFPLLGDCWNHLRGRIQRRGALVLVRRGTRRWDHRQSALFTTVHSGARTTSERETSLSLFWRKFVANKVLFCVSLKNGETRAPTEFAKFVQQRKTKSRLRKRANQDSPWTTKREMSFWF